MFLSSNLKVLREHAGKTQGQFGEIFGLTRDNIASYERGSEPKLSFLIDVADYFHLKLDDLIHCDLNSHKELLDMPDDAATSEPGPKLQKEIEELKRNKAIIAEKIIQQDQQIKRLWEEFDELKKILNK